MLPSALGPHCRFNSFYPTGASEHSHRLQWAGVMRQPGTTALGIARDGLHNERSVPLSGRMEEGPRERGFCLSAFPSLYLRSKLSSTRVEKLILGLGQVSYLAALLCCRQLS